MRPQNHLLGNLIILAMAGLFVVSCQPKPPVWPTQDSVVEDAVQTQLASQTRPTLFPAMDQTSEATSAPVEESTPVISLVTPGVTPQGMNTLAGLVLDVGNLIQIGQDGNTITLYDRPVDILSSDGRYALTSGNGDYWMYDLVEKKLVKLTDTSTRNECCAAWWTGHNEKLLMLSNSAGVDSGVGSQGYLTVIKMDGTGYLVLDPDHPSTGTPAISPDGIWIAYGFGETGWLFGGEQDPTPFNPADFGLSSLKGQQIALPSWSPDGTKIAWFWQSTLNVGPRTGVVVFDLVQKSHRLSVLVEPESIYFPAASPLWSPDGKWIAYTIQAKDALESGTWVMDAVGQQNQIVHLGGSGLVPGAWSPDGEKLALYSLPAAGQDPGLWVATTGTWDLAKVDSPPGLMGRIYLWK